MEVTEGEGRREEGSTGGRARRAVSLSRGRPGEPAGKRAEERRRRDRVWESGWSECGRERAEAACGAGEVKCKYRAVCGTVRPAVVDARSIIHLCCQSKPKAEEDGGDVLRIVLLGWY